MRRGGNHLPGLSTALRDEPGTDTLKDIDLPADADPANGLNW